MAKNQNIIINGISLTSIRFQVYKIIDSHNKPIGAYEILEKLKVVKQNAEAMTVYRSLNFLMSKGLIHDIKSLKKYSSCCHPNAKQCILFICLSCGKKQESHNSKILSDIKELASRLNFTPQASSIDLNGYCSECKN